MCAEVLLLALRISTYSPQILRDLASVEFGSFRQYRKNFGRLFRGGLLVKQLSSFGFCHFDGSLEAR